MNFCLDGVDELPNIEKVKKNLQGMAILDAVIMPEWEFRYFSFNCNWDGFGKEMMASLRDGEGGEYFIHFSENGVVGKVLSDKGGGDDTSLIEMLPDRFSYFKNEPAFKTDEASYFFWRESDGSGWCSAPSNLENYAYLKFLVSGASGYHAWAEEYYERSIDRYALEEVFNSLKINEKQLEILNPDLTLDCLGDDLKEILGSQY